MQIERERQTDRQLKQNSSKVLISINTDSYDLDSDVTHDKIIFIVLRIMTDIVIHETACVLRGVMIICRFYSVTACSINGRKTSFNSFI